MKKSKSVFWLTILIVLAGPAFAKVVIKEAPLTWQHVENAEGGILFNNLCAACHGAGARGDGLAAGALDKRVPDLTTLAAGNDGVYPYKEVRKSISGKTIAGKYRVVRHGTIDMPSWEQQFVQLRPDWTMFRREAYAQKQIESLAEYIENLQVN